MKRITGTREQLKRIRDLIDLDEGFPKKPTFVGKKARSTGLTLHSVDIIEHTDGTLELLTSAAQIDKIQDLRGAKPLTAQQIAALAKKKKDDLEAEMHDLDFVHEPEVESE